MYTAYMAPHSGCTGRGQGEQERPRGTPGPPAPTRRPPCSWSQLMGDLYGAEHGPPGRGSRAPRFRVLRLRSATEARRPRGTQRPLAAGGSLAAPLPGSTYSAPKTQLAGDPGSHCGECRAGWKPDGGWAAQGWLVRTCSPPDPRMGSLQRVSPARRGEVSSTLLDAGSSVEAGGAETPGPNTRRIRPRRLPEAWRSPTSTGVWRASWRRLVLSLLGVAPAGRPPRPAPRDTSTRRRAHDAGPWTVPLRAPPLRTPFRPSCPLLPPQAW